MTRKEEMMRLSAGSHVCFQNVRRKNSNFAVWAEKWMKNIPRQMKAGLRITMTTNIISLFFIMYNNLTGSKTGSIPPKLFDRIL